MKKKKLKKLLAKTPPAQPQVTIAGVATALAVVGVGAMAIGALAIGRLAVKTMALQSGHIDKLLRLNELEVNKRKANGQANAADPGA